MCVCCKDRSREGAKEGGSVGVSAYVRTRQEGKKDIVCVCAHMRVCVCWRERVREIARKSARENGCVGVSTYVRMREEGKREGVCVCARVCMRFLQRESERECKKM